MYYRYRITFKSDQAVGDVCSGGAFFGGGGDLEVVGDEDGEPGAFLEFGAPFGEGVHVRIGNYAAAVESIQPVSQLPLSSGGQPEELR